jgi:hypothetical protein
MRIAAVIVTYERPDLLPRALASVAAQFRPPDFVVVVSNSSAETIALETVACEAYGYLHLQNSRTNNYAGGLNTGVEEIIKSLGIDEEIYFASLDDDDVWLPAYLQTIEVANTADFDLLAAQLHRKSDTEDQVLTLPATLRVDDFLAGNPGISGSNTFIRLQTLLQAGAFDEAMPATVDRDFMVRVLLQEPRYKVIGLQLVIQYVDEYRPRLTTSGEKKAESLVRFHHKYRALMGAEVLRQFLDRAHNLFHVDVDRFKWPPTSPPQVDRVPLVFEKEGDFTFIIGFITGDHSLCAQLVDDIIVKVAGTKLVVIIDNTNDPRPFETIKQQLQSHHIDCRVVHPAEWRTNLAAGHYGSGIQSSTAIDSIPLGRTILHHHLYVSTLGIKDPVYWLIDDDIRLEYLSLGKHEPANFLALVNAYRSQVDAIVGGVNNDPPLPFLSTIRCQLVDYWHSAQAKDAVCGDLLGLQACVDYYYDLSDVCSNHLEFPIYHLQLGEPAMAAIFAGKGVSRKALQGEHQTTGKSIGQRGPNTLVFNRALLKDYPVFNLQVNEKFSRRGDLLWALLNQQMGNRTLIEHTLSVSQERPVAAFNLKKEVEKSAYDIIGYAFNKALLSVLASIATEHIPVVRDSFFKTVCEAPYFLTFQRTFENHLRRRGARFLMNYFRIIGLTKLLRPHSQVAAQAFDLLAEPEHLQHYHLLIAKAQAPLHLKEFLGTIDAHIQSYKESLDIAELQGRDRSRLIEDNFAPQGGLKFLGSGGEGVVYKEERWVYKVLDAISDAQWSFLQSKAACFAEHAYLETIEFHQIGENRIIRYAFHPFRPMQKVNRQEMIEFLKFCRANQIVFSNIKAANFIETIEGQLKYIDYGRTIEPFDEGRFINSTQRAYLLLRFPLMAESEFKEIVRQLNQGEMPAQMNGWNEFYTCITS